jgi:hypothetical protein
MEGGKRLERLLLAIIVVALIAALMAPAAQPEGYWYWCWNASSGSWDYCWWDGAVVQNPQQDVTAGKSTQSFNISAGTLLETSPKNARRIAGVQVAEKPAPHRSRWLTNGTNIG